MKGGKKRNTSTDPVQPSPPPPSNPTTVTDSASDALEDDRAKNSADSGKFRATEESFEEEQPEEDSEAERDYQQTENTQIEEAVVVEGERTKLADGYYEIEAVRRKRVRKVNFLFSFF